MTPQRRLLKIFGVVQGVGFRPFVHQLAGRYGLTGTIQNSGTGVTVEVEGSDEQMDRFYQELCDSLPYPARIHHTQVTQLDPAGYTTFTIRSSRKDSQKSAVILPDLATCPTCRDEIFDPSNRRYLYPFTNCTHCGPRYSIIHDLPYDRTNTSMHEFQMCPHCAAEYHNPADRRFHAQPNACPDCGPQVAFVDQQGNILSEKESALDEAVRKIVDGYIVAIKGVGGYQLMVDAASDDAVQRLRDRKQRQHKPLAVMIPSVAWAHQYCRLSKLEQQILEQPEAPIVLLRKRPEQVSISDRVAPRNPQLGLMLPYSPLHHILMLKLDRPVVCTSANLSDEPICYEDHDARRRLDSIADYYLSHNRPIVRPVDDSVVRIVNNRALMLRPARGFAPLPVASDSQSTATVLALGAHLKNTIAFSRADNVFLSQHIGDLQGVESRRAFEQAIQSFTQIYDSSPEAVAVDMHPGYLSTQFARHLGKPLIEVQHHHAHIVACMAENQLNEEVLGIAFDGTGYGTDHTVWGGEFLRCTRDQFQRVGSLYPFQLQGGDKAAAEPRRSALGLLHELSPHWDDEYEKLSPVQSFTPTERRMLSQLLSDRRHCVSTSSMGRLFDGVAALLGLAQYNDYEGHAAMQLEFSTISDLEVSPYSYDIIHHGSGLWADWRPMIQELIQDIQNGEDVKVLATRFHATVIAMTIDMIKAIGRYKIILSGGCFQNAYLVEQLVQRLSADGYQVYTHQNVPPNDGGIALGQAVCALTKLSTQQQTISLIQR